MPLSDKVPSVLDIINVKTGMLTSSMLTDVAVTQC